MRSATGDRSVTTTSDAESKPNLTAKQRLFISEYMVDMNASKAAIRAGYSEDTAAQIGYENLRKPEIEREIESLMEQRAQRLSVTADYVVSAIRETIERSRQAAPVFVRGKLVEGVFQFDASAVLKGAELLGKHLKLFTEKPEDDEDRITTIIVDI